MTSSDGLDGQEPRHARADDDEPRSSVEWLLIESLVHHLIEKGVLTRNDALSMVQTVAQVKNGQLHEGRSTAATAAELTLLKRLYSSFEALTDRSGGQLVDGDNVLQLRPPLHRDRPEFSRDD